MQQVYLYGITTSTYLLTSAVPGVEGHAAVQLVQYDGLACLTSDYFGAPFTSLPKEAVLRSLLAHQMVIEAAIRDQAVLPLKFGTLVNDRREACAVLAQNQTRLLTALEAIRGKVEFEVAATWDLDQVLREIRDDEEIVRAREAAFRDNNRGIDVRLAVGKLVKTRLDQRREGYRDRMIAFLRPFADAVSSNALVADQLVMNVAFLLDHARLAEFDAAVRTLDQQFEGAITFRIIGPLPPYSFSTVEITRLNSQLIEDARLMLGIERSCTEADVRAAYRRRAADEQRSGTEAERFSRLRLAERVLLDYCQARSDVSPHAADPEQTAGSEQVLFAVRIRGETVVAIERARFGAAEALEGSR